MTPYMKFWRILQLLSAVFGYLLVSAISFNEHSNKQISVINIERFNSKDHSDKTVEFAIFPPPYIRINFFAFDREFRIDLVKDSEFFNSSMTLRVVGGKDNLTINWEPPLYKAQEKLDGVAKASGMYYRRKNTFTGAVFLKNAIYYLEPAKYHFSEYSNDDSALLVTKVNRLFTSTLPDVDWDVNKGKPNIVCDMELYGDHTYLKIMRYSFENAAGLMVYHTVYVDNMFQQHDVGRKHLRFFPKRSTIFLERFNKNYSNQRELIYDFALEFDTACLSALFIFRNFEDRAEAGTAFNNGVCQNMNRLAPGVYKQFNKVVLTIEFLKKFTPICATLMYLAHEVGHSFSCEHDPQEFGSECSPRNDSRYFLYPFGDPFCTHTQQRYSPCSLNSIRHFIEQLYATGIACFKQY